MDPGGPVIALIDGEHHPPTVRDALDRLDHDRGVAGVVFCGGEEKVPDTVLESPKEHYGRAVESGRDPSEALRRLASSTGAVTVADLADEPVLRPPAKLRLAALALHLGLGFESPGLTLRVPRYEDVDVGCPRLAVIGTGKRTGKTAVAGHWAALLAQRGTQPVIVSMGRGGPPEPQLAEAGISVERLEEIVASGRHGASDYLEDAALAGVETVGCRRVGGGLAGVPYESNVVEGAALAASLDPDVVLFEGSGACIPPVAVDRTLCVAGTREDALGELGPYRLMRADLALVMGDDAELAEEVAKLVPGETLRVELCPEPVEELSDDARVAVFSTGDVQPTGVEPVLTSSNLARRSALADDLERAADEGCDVYLTELKAAAIDTVAPAARRAGAGIVFLRNRPVGLDADLDEALVMLHADA